MIRTIVLDTAERKQRALEAVCSAQSGDVLRIGPPTRNLEQNAAQWPILEAFSQQLKWPVNGQMVNMSAEEWKDLLSAAFRKEQARIAMGLDGGVVMLGQRTSKFGKKEFSDWLEFLHATAADRGVVVYPEERIAA
jgi:hypothetical protein